MVNEMSLRQMAKGIDNVIHDSSIDRCLMMIVLIVWKRVIIVPSIVDISDGIVYGHCLRTYDPNLRPFTAHPLQASMLAQAGSRA